MVSFVIVSCVGSISDDAGVVVIFHAVVTDAAMVGGYWPSC